MGRDMSSFQPVDRTIRSMSIEDRVTVSEAEFHRDVGLSQDYLWQRAEPSPTSCKILKQRRESRAALSAAH
jgi:hypothetical protein